MSEITLTDATSAAQLAGWLQLQADAVRLRRVPPEELRALRARTLVEARAVRSSTPLLWTPEVARELGRLLRAVDSALYIPEGAAASPQEAQAPHIQSPTSFPLLAPQPSSDGMDEGELDLNRGTDRQGSRDAVVPVHEKPDIVLFEPVDKAIEILRDDPSQHNCNLREFFRIFVSWSCIFVFCHAPWVAAMAVVLQQTWDAGSGGGSATAPCNDTLRLYLNVFLFIFIGALALGLAGSLARAVDRGENVCKTLSTPTTCVTSVVIVAFNMYGVIVIWPTTTTDECNELRSMAVALVTMYLVLPCCCGAIQSQVGTLVGHDNPDSSSADPGKDKAGSTSASRGPGPGSAQGSAVASGKNAALGNV